MPLSPMLKIRIALVFVLSLLGAGFAAGDRTFAFGAAPFGATEYTGQFLPDLVPETEDLDRITFKPLTDLSKFKFVTPLKSDALVTGARLYNAQKDDESISALLVETATADPMLYADVNQDGTFDDAERFPLVREEADSPYLWNVTFKVPMSGSLFNGFPLHLQYIKDVQLEAGIQPEERFVRQSKAAFAQGLVDVKGHKTLVAYAFDAKSKKISPEHAWLGVDGNGDGKIDSGRFAWESTEADDESIVFRTGDTFVSTKRADLAKNQIVLQEHPAADYKRIEINLGGQMPEISFTDFDGKQRKLSEFRGKYLLLDFWGYWCPACREELPYLKAAYAKFQSRNFEILGINTDEDADALKSVLKRSGMSWNQARLLSVKDLILGLRVHLWPSTMLLDPSGKIVSMSEHGQPSLRGEELDETLEKLLPK